MATIGDNLHRIIFPQDGGGGDLKKIVDELNDYRSEHFSEIKKMGKLKVSDLDHWMRNNSHLKDYDIISIAKVLDCSCDEILLGTPPAERNIVDDLGLSGKTLEYLRKENGQEDYSTKQMLGDTWSQLINFFFDNGFAGLLSEMREYIIRDIKYDMALDQFIRGEGSTLPQLSESDWSIIYSRRMQDRMEESRKKYQKMYRKEIEKDTQAKLMKGADPDGETGERGRNHKTEEA